MAISATIGGALAGASIYQGRKAEKAMKKSLLMTQQAQARAERNAVAEQAKALSAEARARKKQANIDDLIDGEMLTASKGVNSTMLTGTRGPGNATYGSQSLLGG